MCFDTQLLAAVLTSLGLPGPRTVDICRSLAVLLPDNFPCSAVNHLLVPLAPLSQVEVISVADLECLGVQLHSLSV